jgi:hypothetical protein
MPDEEPISLREYFEALLDAHKESHDQRHIADQAALIAARDSISARLEVLNELRSDVVKDRTQFITREAFEAQYDGLERRCGQLENWRAKATGVGAVLVIVSGAIGAAIFKVLGG